MALPSPSGRGAGGEGQTLAHANREHTLAVLRDTDWVLGGPKGAASRLGMKRSTLHWKMKKLDISRPQWRPPAGTCLTEGGRGISIQAVPA
jgi:formate hydrogenlyase transcriptional activator